MADTTVDFHAADLTNLGLAISDGAYTSNDVPGLDIRFFVGDGSGTANGTNLVYVNQGPIAGVTSEEGAGEPSFVIKEHGGAEFWFKGIFLQEYVGGAFDIRIEGFRNGASTGSVQVTVDPASFERYFTTTQLEPSKFQNVDEVRITNASGGSLWLNYDKFVFSEAVVPNAAPSATNLTQTVPYGEDPVGAVALADIVVTDADGGDVLSATLTLSNANAGSLSVGTFGAATSAYNAGTGVWTVSGALADVNSALASVAFTPAANWDQNVTITTRVRDAANAGPADGTIALNVTAANDAPAASNLTQTRTYSEDAVSVALDDIVVSDVDTGETITATLTLSVPAAGVFTTGTFGAATSTYNAGTGVWTVVGSAADVNSALAAVAFTPAPNWEQDVTVTSRIRDAAGSGPADGTITLDVTATNNDAPTASNLTHTIAYTEDPVGGVALSDIVVSDADASDTITASLNLTTPAAGSLSTGTFGAATPTYDPGTGLWLVTGSVADVNAALAAVSFTPAANWDRDVTITTRIRDGANTGPADGTITLDVTGSNDAATATNLTQTVAYNEDAGSVALGDIVVADVDTGETITATLTLSNAAAGGLSVGTFGLATSAYNTGTGVWSVVGSVADVNAALAATTFTPAANWAQDVTIATRIRDAAGAGPADGTITLDVTPSNDNPTGSVTISGTAAQGETLTAVDGLVDPDGKGTLSYKWFADGQEINGATASTYSLGQADVGKKFSVEISYTDQGGTSQGGASAETSPVANVNDGPTGAVTITGTAAEGQILSVSNTLADLDGMSSATVTYQWRVGGDDIIGANGTTFTLTQDHVGKQISVVASYTDDTNHAESKASDPTVPVANLNSPPTGMVTISGTPAQGQVLTASNTLADADGLNANNITYQWRADGQDISGATSSTYTLTQGEVGKIITVAAKYTDDGGTAEAPESAATAAVANLNDHPTGSVSVSGSATQGQTLTASNTLADLDGLNVNTIAYQWKAGGAAIPGATNSTFTLTQAEVGKTITVTASYTDGQGTLETKDSEATTPVANVNDAPTGAVTITGAPSQGQTLTASHTLVDLDGMTTSTVTYQWRADGADIAGATSATYTLTAGELGKAITVVAKYTDDANHLESRTSAATTAVTAPPPQPDPQPPVVPTTTIDGVPVQTGTVTNSDGTTSQTVTIPVVTPRGPRWSATTPSPTSR